MASQLQIQDILDLRARAEQLPELKQQYAAASPYPHIVFDDALRPEIVDTLYSELELQNTNEWKRYVHVNERKHANPKPETWGPTLQAVARALTSPEFVSFVGELTGFDDLLPDWSMDGGGLHRSGRGGYLNVHTDFTAHHMHPTWRRRVNLLLYLNPEWRRDWGGELELWSADMSRCVTRVAPKGNRMLLFTTDERSYHGHPTPMECPEHVFRQSLALYYFTEESEKFIRSTNYRARPGDGGKALSIFVDRQLLRIYDRGRRVWLRTKNVAKRPPKE